MSEQCRLLDSCVDSGCNAVDTARIYSGSERLIGRWLRTGIERGRAVIFTKCCHPPLFNWSGNRLTLRELTRDVETSLKALQTDYIDVLLFHRDHEDADLESLLDGVARLRREGKLRAYGVSNWTHRRIALLMEAARKMNTLGPSVASVHYSLFEWAGDPPWRGCVSVAGAAGVEARDWYRRATLPLFAWAPLASGFATFRLGSCRSSLPRHYDLEANRYRLAKLEDLAYNKGLSPAQVALAYLANQQINLFAIKASSDAAHVASNISAMTIALSPAELECLDAAQFKSQEY